MKWLPSRGSHNRNLRWVDFCSPYSFNSTSQATKFFICLLSTGMFLSGDAAKFKVKSLTFASAQSLSTQISKVAVDISVKVLAQDFLGSGFIVMHQDNRYIVITNQHVLRAGDAPYQIQTADGQIHSAEVVASLITSKNEYDVALLQFTTDNTYPTAKIGSSADLQVGEPIFAAGFPHNQVKTQNYNAAIFEHPQFHKLQEFALKPGRVAIILNKALEEGYQIGYTNDVQKGMSGGPLLNIQGEVVGINGKHAYPLWESPEIYQDGSQPCPALQDLITRSSLAIPIEKSIELNPKFEALRATSEIESDRQSNLLLEDRNLVIKMQTEAKITTQSCKDFEPK